MIGFVSCPPARTQWFRRNNIIYENDFSSSQNNNVGHWTQNVEHRHNSYHPPIYLPTTYLPTVRLSGTEMTQRRKKPTKRSIGACVHDEKSRIWVIVVWDARAKIKHIGMRRQKLWPVISLSLARPPSFPSSVHTHTHIHTFKYVCARMCVCAYVYVCVRCSAAIVRARPVTLLGRLFITRRIYPEHISSRLSRSHKTHTHTHTHAVSRPPSLRVQKTTQAAAAAAECSTNVLRELATYTHTHTNATTTTTTYGGIRCQRRMRL